MRTSYLGTRAASGVFVGDDHLATGGKHCGVTQYPSWWARRGSNRCLRMFVAADYSRAVAKAREQFPLRAGFRAYSPAIVSLCRRARFRRWLHNQGDVARIDRHSGRSADFRVELRDQGALPVSRSLSLPPTQDQERHPRRESRSLRSAIRRWSFASSRRRRPAPVLLRRSCDVRRRPRRSRWLRSAV